MKLMQKAITAMAAATAVLVGAGSAGAATVITNPPFTLSDTSFGTQLGVHANGGMQVGNTINAHVNQEGSAVTFTSTNTLSQTGGGEAILNGPFNNLDVTFAHGWAAITFAFDAGATDSNMSIFVNGSATPIFTDGPGGNCSICLLSANGEQKFTISTTGTGISELDFTFSKPIVDAKQFRVATEVPPIPEPATWAMLILGVAMIGAAARRRNAGLALAA